MRILSLSFAVILLLLTLALPACKRQAEAPATTTAATATAPATAPVKIDPTDIFFSTGQIPNLRIRLTPKEEQYLRQDPRRYVDASLIENDKTTYKKVQLKLKGAVGSFRPLDDRPALSLKLTQKDQRFHGMDKFHLNNSIQDDSYLNELLASQIIREAGYPATRVSHARVWINDRDLGFYVLKEAFDEDFLQRNFSDSKGNLYEGTYNKDIDSPLEKDVGDDSVDPSDLKSLLAACREGDPNKRGPLVAAQLDVDKFLTFTALELMLCHWDGYAMNRNNYRIYFRGSDQKAVFLLHGLDQLFRDPNYAVFNIPQPIVAKAVLETPEWNAQYRHRIRELLPLFAPEKLHAKIDAAHVRIRPVLATISEDRAKQFDERVRDLKNRVAERQKFIRSQSPPEPLAFNKDGFAPIEGWEPRPDGDAKLEKKEIDRRPALSIETGPSNRCIASFRAKARLAKGRYILEARAKTNNVIGIDDQRGLGAGLRISGGIRENKVIGTADWTSITHPFDVTEELREVELIAELRSTAGNAIFDLASFRVQKK